MWISPKRYIRNAAGAIVEAGPGISGTLVVAEGAGLPEAKAMELGLLKHAPRPSSPVSQPIDRGTGKAEEPLASNTVVEKPWETAATALPQTIGVVPDNKEPAALDIEETT